eukprot:TRINITY_DN6494_c0_g1_i1.p1 TRINITY_DN6494_c0_g1~~TRINITY_DN6494_c0_g1_i1.p1  ORF type:complete len:475 (-),score=64.80 TRINITY_DN6494_c0_g1_i1:88-1512(-)
MVVPLALLFLTLLYTSFGQPLEIEEFYAGLDFVKDSPWDYELILKEVPSTKVLLQVSGDSNYGTQVWPAGAPGHLNVTWHGNSSSSWLLTQDHPYTLRASGDGQNWGKPVQINCCKYHRPENQSTIVLSDWIEDSVDTKTEKILIKNKAAFWPEVSVSTLWEMTIENNVYFVVGKNPSELSSEFPVNISGLNFLFSLREHSYTPNVRNQTVKLLWIKNAFGRPALQYDSEDGSGCTLKRWNQEPLNDGVLIVASVDCGEGISRLIFAWPIIIVSVVYLAVIFLLFKKFEGISFGFINGCFGMTAFAIAATGASEWGLAYYNTRFCKECSLSLADFLWKLCSIHIPISFGVFFCVVCIVWLHVAIFVFPDKGTYARRRAVYFIGFAILLVLTWISVFVPFVLEVSITPIALLLALGCLLLPVILVLIYVSTLCTNSCSLVEKCFRYEGDGYDVLGDIQEYQQEQESDTDGYGERN